MAVVSKNMGTFASETEKSMGECTVWWIGVSHQQQFEQQKTTAEAEILKRVELESELHILKQFIKERNIMKEFKQFSEKHKPEENGQGLSQEP